MHDRRSLRPSSGAVAGKEIERSVTEATQVAIASKGGVAGSETIIGGLPVAQQLQTELVVARKVKEALDLRRSLSQRRTVTLTLWAVRS